MSLRKSIKHFQRISSLKIFSFNRQLSSLYAAPEPKQTQDPYSCLKEDPIDICFSIWVKSFASPSTFTYTNLTGFLTKLDLWVLAYQRCCAHFTSTFPSRSSIPNRTLGSLLSLRDAIVKDRFKWDDRANQIVRSPNDSATYGVMSKRRLDAMLKSDVPLFQDRVVQEVLLMVLEPIFESRFSKKSHGFRPGRNPHTVIRTIRSNFAGYLWFLRGDLSEILDNVDDDRVMEYIKKVVKDKKVLTLIKFGLRENHLKRGVDDCDGQEKKKKTPTKKKKILNPKEPKPDPYWLRTFFNFAPEEAAKIPSYGCCGILSPLLANICLNELDQMMEEKMVEFFRPNKNDSIWRESVDDGCHNPSWPEFVPSSGNEKTRKMDYIRFGAHFLVGIRGPREEAVRIRKEIIEFCESKFAIKLDTSKIEIEHISRGIQFLDHIICRRVVHPTLRYTSSGGSIVSEKGIGTLLSVTACLQQCVRQFRRLQLVKGDKDPEPLPCTPMLYSSQSHSNSQMNKFLETMADWYKYADNRKKVVGFCAYVIRSSLAKLYAARYRLKSRAKVYRIASRNLSNPIRDNSKNSAPEYSDLLRMGLVNAIEGVQFSHMALIPSCDYTPFARNWVPDHEKLLHEYIRLQDPKFFCSLSRSIKRQGLSLPQDEISEILWNCKTFGLRSYYQSDVNKQTNNGSAEVKESV